MSIEIVKLLFPFWTYLDVPYVIFFGLGIYVGSVVPCVLYDRTKLKQGICIGIVSGTLASLFLIAYKVMTYDSYIQELFVHLQKIQ